jgi:hypothetical protein
MKLIIDLKNYEVLSTSTIHDCLIKIELNNLNTLLVIESGQVIGTLTDGDIRKSLINMRSLLMEVRQIMNKDYIFAKSSFECNELFVSYEYINLIPVIDENCKLIQLFSRY